MKAPAMKTSARSGEIACGLYCAADAEEMTGLLATAFSRHDPPAVAVGITPEEFAAFVQILLPAVAAERLTVIARDRRTGEMAGVLLTEDAASDAAEGMERLGRKFETVGSILGALVERYRAGRVPERGEMLHLYLLGVAERFAGKGVAQQLVAACVENGRRRGYRVAVAEATNKTSQHIFRKAGFVERAQVLYAEHVFEGKRPFASIAEHAGPILMEQVLATGSALN